MTVTGEPTLSKGTLPISMLLVTGQLLLAV